MVVGFIVQDWLLLNSTEIILIRTDFKYSNISINFVESTTVKEIHKMTWPCIPIIYGRQKLALTLLVYNNVDRVTCPLYAFEWGLKKDVYISVLHIYTSFKSVSPYKSIKQHREGKRERWWVNYLQLTVCINQVTEGKKR